jgi:hypothetical protein
MSAQDGKRRTISFQISGVAALLIGLALLGVVGRAIYRPEAAHLLLDLGIPGVLLVTLAGLVLTLSGGALLVGRRGPGRPG